MMMRRRDFEEGMDGEYIRSFIVFQHFRDVALGVEQFNCCVGRRGRFASSRNSDRAKDLI